MHSDGLAMKRLTRDMIPSSLTMSQRARPSQAQSSTFSASSMKSSRSCSAGACGAVGLPLQGERFHRGEAHMVRIGIVGIGFMGWIHYLATKCLQGAQLAAICSRDPQKRAGDLRGIRGNFGPPGEMVDLGG